MDRIRKVIKQTDNRFLNMYELEVAHRDGKTSPYYMASRMEDPAKIKAVTKNNNPNGVIMYGIYGEQKDKVVLVRQYRYPIGSYVYEFPAGLVEP
jgi:ADP-ribose pyrophosphatase